ncbi:MAG: winged helix-turn-helix domain-containing protein [Caulobacterales bacterium]
MPPDETIHQSLRLRIMATLNALPRAEKLEFTRLKAILKATDGNLGAHISTLETAGYVAVEKDFADKKPRTRVTMTPAGRRAFEAHVGYLRALLDGGEDLGESDATR